MGMLSETCLTCGTPRCQSCPVHKQPRWLGNFNAAFRCGLESYLNNQPCQVNHWHRLSTTMGPAALDFLSRNRQIFLNPNRQRPFAIVRSQRLRSFPLIPPTFDASMLLIWIHTLPTPWLSVPSAWLLFAISVHIPWTTTQTVNYGLRCLDI
jgi:hypothetical protein